MFIVWDKKKKVFVDLELHHNVVIDMDGDTHEVFQGMEGDVIVLKSYYSTHQYIGKTDIYNKKIYADCSVVEFDIWIGNKTGTRAKHKKIGHFYFDKNWLQYRIKYDGGNINLCVDIENLKIIDTLQENKLGLIK